MSTSHEQLKHIIEAALMASGEPMSVERIEGLFNEDAAPPSRDMIREALERLAEESENRGVELKQVGSGYPFQAKQEYASWVGRLWEEKPPRYSRALLETLVLVAYKQPITRGEIEDIRGVAVSSHIIKTLQEREWIRVVGHRDVPGRPALYATTRAFLDYFNLKSLEELPTLAEIRDLDKISAELDMQGATADGLVALNVEDDEAELQPQNSQPQPQAVTDETPQMESAASNEPIAAPQNTGDGETTEVFAHDTFFNEDEISDDATPAENIDSLETDSLDEELIFAGTEQHSAENTSVELYQQEPDIAASDMDTVGEEGRSTMDTYETREYQALEGVDARDRVISVDDAHGDTVDASEDFETDDLSSTYGG